MTISIKHAFVSGKADGTDTTLVQPSNWNADLTTSMATGKVVGRTSAGTGAFEEIALSTFCQAANNLSDVANASTARSNIAAVGALTPGAGLQNAGTTSAFGSAGGTLALDGAFGSRNRIINPSGQIALAGLASTADANYTGFDQWLALTQTGAVTPSQLTSASTENGTPYMMRLTQAQASAQRFGLIQPLEFANVIDLRGKNVVLSARVRMSASTTLRYAIVEWTGTADSPTKDVVNDWTSGTFTTGNFFISTSTTIVATGSIALTANTLTDITALVGTVSGSMNNLHVFFWTDSTQAQNVTLDIGKAQLEQGLQATPLAFRDIETELRVCKRYFRQFAPSGAGIGENSTTSALFTIEHNGMRTAPSVSATNTIRITDVYSGDFTQSSANAAVIDNSVDGGLYRVGNFSGLTAGRSYVFRYFTGAVGAGILKLDARL